MERIIDLQLDKLKTRIIKMCSLVDEQVQAAIKLINEENITEAESILARDRKVDKYDLKIGKICQRIFALNQPVAMDLRLIMSALNINTNLERIGDLAVNIVDNFTRIKKKPHFFERTKFTEMAAVASEMLKNAIDSFIAADPSIAEKVIRAETSLDKLNIENHSVLIEIMKEDKENIEPAVVFLLICRQLERLGDHATNIAEDIYFIVEAQTIRHKYLKYFMNEYEIDNELDSDHEDTD